MEKNTPAAPASHDREPADEDEIRDFLQSMIKAEIARSGLSYQEIANRLRKRFGARETPNSIAVKLSRCRFKATFLLELYAVLGAGPIDVPTPRETGPAPRCGPGPACGG